MSDDLKPVMAGTLLPPINSTPVQAQLIRVMCCLVKRGGEVRNPTFYPHPDPNIDHQNYEIMVDRRAPQEGTDLHALMILIAKLYYAPRDDNGAIVEMSDEEFYELMMLRYAEMSDRHKHERTKPKMENMP